MRATLLVGIVLLVGCGGGGSDGGNDGGPGTVALSCVLSAQAGPGCLEWSVSQTTPADGFRQSCTQQGGTFVSGACPATNRIGTCALVQLGVNAKMVFYTPATVASAQQACAAASGVWTTG
jgi:hypothetical protein